MVTAPLTFFRGPRRRGSFQINWFAVVLLSRRLWLFCRGPRRVLAAESVLIWSCIKPWCASQASLRPQPFFRGPWRGGGSLLLIWSLTNPCNEVRRRCNLDFFQGWVGGGSLLLICMRLHISSNNWTNMCLQISLNYWKSNGIVARGYQPRDESQRS